MAASRSTNSYYVILPIVILSFSCGLSVIRGTILTKPENVTTEEGKDVYFVCSSTVFKRNIYWYWSEARQLSVRVVYDGKIQESEQGKFEESHEIVGNIRTSTLVIKKINVGDAGTVICREDESYGQAMFAEMSVVNVYTAAPIRSGLCRDNILYLACKFCYRSENTLVSRWKLSHSTFIAEMHSKDIPIPDDKCIQHESYAVIEHSCLDNETLSVAVYDNKTNTASPSYDIKVVVQNSESDKKNTSFLKKYGIENDLDDGKNMKPFTPVKTGSEIGLTAGLAVMTSAVVAALIVICLLLHKTRRLRDMSKDRCSVETDQCGSTESNGETKWSEDASGLTTQNQKMLRTIEISKTKTCHDNLTEDLAGSSSLNSDDCGVDSNHEYRPLYQPTAILTCPDSHI